MAKSKWGVVEESARDLKREKSKESLSAFIYPRRSLLGPRIVTDRSSLLFVTTETFPLHRHHFHHQKTRVVSSHSTFFSFLRFPTNRLADHPFAQTCTIEFNQFFFCVCSIRPLYPPPTLSDVSEKCCGMSAFPFFLFLLCVLLLLLASFRRRRRRRRRRSSVAMAPIESDLINLQGELDSELDFAQRKSNAPLHPFSHPCSNPCSIDKMYLLRIYPYRERRKERNIAYHACLPFM